MPGLLFPQSSPIPVGKLRLMSLGPDLVVLLMKGCSSSAVMRTTACGYIPTRNIRAKPPRAVQLHRTGYQVDLVNRDGEHTRHKAPNLCFARLPSAIPGVSALWLPSDFQTTRRSFCPLGQSRVSLHGLYMLREEVGTRGPARITTGVTRCMGPDVVCLLA